jgi:anti-sigma B factor antagonist
MRIIERPIRATTILEMHGTLTGPAATGLLDATVRRVTGAGAGRLVINLEDVPSIDAAGLGALVAAYHVVRRNGGTIRLARPARRVHQLLVVCRLVTVFETFDSVEDALSASSEAGPRFLRGASQPALHRARLLFNHAIGRLTGARKESLNV